MKSDVMPPDFATTVKAMSRALEIRPLPMVESFGVVSAERIGNGWWQGNLRLKSRAPISKEAA